MKKIKRSHIFAGVSVAALGAVALAFQNFTPHKSITENDVGDLYMNTALSTALKTRANEHKPAGEVAFNKNVGESTERKPASAEANPDAPDYQDAMDSEAQDTTQE